MSHYREPVKYTCPDIDKVIKAIKNIQKTCNPKYTYDNLDGFKDALSNIENECWNLEDILEKLRKSNDELRNWGEEEATNFDKLESSIL